MASQSLESRVVPTLTAGYVAGLTAITGTLTLTGEASVDEDVTVAAGSTYTDVSVGGELVARIQGAKASNISTIIFSGAETGDTLNIQGVSTALLTVTLGDASKLTAKTGALTVTATDNLALQESIINGALSVTASGKNITDDGKLTVSGTTTLTTGAGNITLDFPGSSFGSLVITAATGDVSIAETAETTLGTISAKTLTLTSTGNVTQDKLTTATVTGATSITATGKNITLDKAANAFSDTVSLRGANVTLYDAGTTKLGTVTATGTLTVTSTGALTESGKITAAGITTLSAT